MSVTTVTYKAKFERPARQKKAAAVKKPAVPAGERPPSRAAQSLALAYLVERLIDEGRLESYAEAARLLGVTRARMTQVMDLRNLPVEVQEETLLGGIEAGERRLRRRLLRPKEEATKTTSAAMLAT